MATTAEDTKPQGGTAPRGFLKGHHIAYISRDQAATLHFYEDIIGLPLVQAWAEAAEFPEFPGRTVEYCHTFFALDDGSTLAFFAFADDDVYQTYKRQHSPFIHPAVKVTPERQEAVLKRIQAEGIQHFMIDHGFVKSLYIADPDGLTFELAVDPEDYDAIAEWQGKTAHDTVRRWVAGDRTPNNNFRDDHAFQNLYS
jgi:glyoxylase I family protein